MDRRRAQLGLLTAVLCGSAIAAEPLRAALWLAPETDVVTALTARPAECLSIPDDPEAALSVEIGRAAFRTPLLLGGQAARVGLSCNSCHINGHGNSDFLFPGLSGASGTADVTSAVMSEVRGDGAFNPKPIPDLTGSEAALASRDHESGELELFIHGLVVEEFAGEAPSDPALAGLAAYVRALSPDACVGEDHESITVAAEISDARRALFAAQRVLERGDGETAALMLAAVRSKLGEIDERFAGDDLTEERGALRAAAAELGQARLLARDDAQAAYAALEPWPARLTELESVLVAAERRSLYDAEILASALD